MAHTTVEQARASAIRREVNTPYGVQVWHGWNTAAGNPLVLLHGGSGSWTHWTRSVLPLSQNRAVWALDIPGFGESELPPQARDVDALHEPMAHGLRAVLGDVPHDIMGFSFGGMAAGYVAAFHPELVRRLVLVGVPGLGLFTSALPLRGLTDDMNQAQRWAVHRHNLLTIMLHSPDSVDDDTLALQDRNVQRDRLRRRRIARSDILVQLQTRWQCPVHGIWGAHDALYANGLLAQVSGKFAQCHWAGLHVIDGAGHWVQHEQPERFVQQALRCLAGEGE